MTHDETDETDTTIYINNLERGFVSNRGGFVGNGQSAHGMASQASQKHARGPDAAQNARATDRPRAWIDDPWSAMSTGEGEAYRRGWEAARKQAVTLARSAPIPEDASPAEAYGRMAGTVEAAQAIEAMEPPV